jgi:ribosomal-protein-alanine N-acetyltransferase
MMIAPLEADQVDAVTDMEAIDGDVHWSRAQFQKELAAEVRRFFVAMEEGAPDILAYGGYWKAGPEAQITNLVVGKESRCRGIAKRLIEFILDCARSEGCTVCTLEVRKSNAHAQALYKNLGFEVQGSRPRMYADPIEDAILMEKKL